jgi:polysaccharide pyruvyl transferase WcaK-like protein
LHPKAGKAVIIEIHGAGFQNKGAELMLRAAVSELRRRLPQFVPAIDPAYGPYDARCGLRLHQIFPARFHVGSKAFSRRFRYQKLFASLAGAKLMRLMLGVPLSSYGCVSLGCIEGLIDVAGFAYTDQWGSKPTRDFASLTAYYKRREKPVIMLPQAFGPFQRNETRAAFKEILRNATLIFARDQQSHEYILELGADPDRISKAPDITLFYPDLSTEGAPTDGREGYACLVPNVRVLDQGREKWGDKYRAYLLDIVKELMRCGLPVKVIVHDASGQDLKLAQQIRDEASSPAVTLACEEDPTALKRLISKSLMVVGSRYHSLVTAFSAQVPAIAIGWSHKYDMLFRDFGCEKYVLSPETPIETALQYVRELSGLDNNISYRRQIAPRLQEMYTTNQRMWDRVTDVLVGRSVE